MENKEYEKIQCKHCGMRMDSSTQKCPLCGEINDNYESLRHKEKEEKKENARIERSQRKRRKKARFVECELCGNVYDRNIKQCPECKTTNKFYPKKKKISFWIKGIFLFLIVIIGSFLIYSTKTEKKLTSEAKKMPLEKFKAKCNEYDYKNEYLRIEEMMEGKYVKLEKVTIKDEGGWFIGTGENKEHIYELDDIRKNKDKALLDGDEVIVYGVYHMLSKDDDKLMPIIYIIDVEFVNN